MDAATSTLIFMSSSKSVAVSSSLVVVVLFSVFVSFVAFVTVVGSVVVAIAASPRPSIELEASWSLVTDIGTAVVIVVVSEYLSEVFADSV